jgi:PAS domain S-box-containing protein
LEALTAHYTQLEIWAEHCPENFENRAALVRGEIARIQGREFDAMRLYKQAILSAEANGFVHNEALAYEVAARFYAARGFDKLADAYLREARCGYLRWGADGKVRQLDQLYPHIGAEESGLTSTIQASVEHLDLATVMKVSQAVSGEIVLERLMDTLMRTAIEHAGAERGLLFLAQGDEFRIEAEATTSGDTVTVGLRQASVNGEDLPESVFHYAVRTKERVLLNDASGANQFSADEYIQRHHARSILCQPLLKQSRLVGVLYLENNLAPYAFTPDRIAVLTLLASEAVTSLENARVYADLREQEAKVRRLVDTALDAVVIIDEQGWITEWNAQAETMFGWRREEAVGQRLSEILIPMRYRSDHEKGLSRFLTSGEGSFLNRTIEIEAVHRNGSEFPVELSVAAFRIGGTWAFSGFVRDITERKRAEATLRRYREVEMELAHANRVAAMGQMSTSIAHEVNQPVGAAITNAHVALHWLDSGRPEKVRQALSRTIKSCNRASEVIDRIRAFIKKAPPRMDSLEINDAILEVIALTRSEAVRNGISVQTQLAEGLPPIHGDRVQLQQVVLNLIINAQEAMSGLGEGARELLISTAKAKSDGVFVVVRDSGPGLSPTNLERVFEAFYTTKSDGLGMGLSICRSIIEAHGGRLWATASEPQGTIFEFTLPTHPDSPS